MYVYILASRFRGTIYIGVTSDLVKRVHEHKSKIIYGFTAKYDVTLLVHFEQFEDALTAIAREKQLKFWRRQWKINLVENSNPEWNDLYPSLIA